MERQIEGWMDEKQTKRETDGQRESDQQQMRVTVMTL